MLIVLFYLLILLHKCLASLSLIPTLYFDVMMKITLNSINDQIQLHLYT